MLNKIYNGCEIINTTNNSRIFFGTFTELYNLIKYHFNVESLYKEGTEDYYEKYLPEHWKVKFSFHFSEEDIQKLIEIVEGHENTRTTLSNLFDADFGDMPLSEMTEFDWLNYAKTTPIPEGYSAFKWIDSEYEYYRELRDQAAERIITADFVKEVTNDHLNSLHRKCADKLKDTSLFMFTQELYLAKPYETIYIIEEISGQGETFWNIESIDDMAKSESDFKYSDLSEADCLSILKTLSQIVFEYNLIN